MSEDRNVASMDVRLRATPVTGGKPSFAIGDVQALEARQMEIFAMVQSSCLETIMINLECPWLRRVA